MSIFREDRVILTSTDTTIGFLSKSKDRLDSVKNRSGKEYIEVFNAFSSLSYKTPVKHRNFIRRAKKVSFILPSGKSFRVVKDKEHLVLLKRVGRIFSTSANLTDKKYDYKFAFLQADIILYPLKNKSLPSTIYKLSKSGKMVKIR